MISFSKLFSSHRNDNRCNLFFYNFVLSDITVFFDIQVGIIENMLKSIVEGVVLLCIDCS